MAKNRNAGLIVLGLLGLLLFSLVTYFAVDAAGGTGVSPSYSNTRNAVVPGPPAFK